MGEKYQAYRKLNYNIPQQSWAWNLYGAGLDNMGRGGEPEPFSVPEPSDDQLLVRIDSIGVCFSDVKILKGNLAREGGSPWSCETAAHREPLAVQFRRTNK